MSKLVVVYGNDWEGLYIDNVCVVQDHHLDLKNTISYLVGLQITSYEVLCADSDWLEGIGYLPESLEDVRLAGQSCNTKSLMNMIKDNQHFSGGDNDFSKLY